MASTTSTPFRPPYPGAGPSRTKSSPYLTTHPSSSTTSLNPFTPAMRDRQARGKDPYRGGGDEYHSDYDDDLVFDDSDDRPSSSSKMRLGGARLEKEDHARAERRHKAVAFLENPELLMMYAQSKGDSIPGARLHFTRMLCGYEKPEAAGKAKAAAAGAGGSGEAVGRRKSGGLGHGGGGSGVGKSGRKGDGDKRRAGERARA